jgi:hypothetical protein
LIHADADPDVLDAGRCRRPAQATGGRMIGAGSSLESCSSRNTFQLWRQAISTPATTEVGKIVRAAGLICQMKRVLGASTFFS